jgi:peptidoglycan hydrolase-like protein with peptidoglycan-binding domain
MPKVKRWCCGALLLLLAGAASAEEQVRRAQEELRRRNLYFGEVDGRLTEETVSAVRRYQTRKRLPVSGELTASTLRSLDIPVGVTGEQSWPDVAVLKSDAAREIRESDRDLLEQMATATPESVGDGPEAVPPRIEEVPEPPAEPGGEVKPPVVEAAPAESGAPLKEERLTKEEVRAMIESYLAACEASDPERELQFYADRVNYFDHGTVKKEFVARDVHRFYKRWPRRQYKLLDLQIAPASQDAVEATFRISFQYEGAQKVSGKTLNRFRVERDASGLRFTALKEQRVRN